MRIACLASLPVLVAAACGTEFREPPAAAQPIPTRARLVTDVQYGNAVHDLLGAVDVPPLHTAGATEHQFIHDDVLAVDPVALVQYRMAAEMVARQVAADPTQLGCTTGDDACARAKVGRFAARAFRRPLLADEDDALWAMFQLGRDPDDAAGFALVVEAVLQAPDFVYRRELGGTPDASGVVELTPPELAAELGFLFYDSLPDDALRAAADDGTLAQPAVLADQVDRLLAEPRVRAHLDAAIGDWLELQRVLEVGKDRTLFPEFDDALRASMYRESALFVDDVLWHRGARLRELLVSRQSFADGRLAALYGYAGVTGDVHVPITHDARRAGLLGQAGMLAGLASEQRESIIQRGMYVHRHFLCTAELGRPPFSTIAELQSFTDKLSESQFSHYRMAHVYCSHCHLTVDPPGRTFEGFDGLGRARAVDELGVAVETWAHVDIGGELHDLNDARDLAYALAGSDAVARCVVDQLAHHAFGRVIDERDRAELTASFDDADRDLVQAFRAIALSPAFRQRQGVAP